jgi:hypothetical protein
MILINCIQNMMGSKQGLIDDNNKKELNILEVH